MLNLQRRRAADVRFQWNSNGDAGWTICRFWANGRNEDPSTPGLDHGIAGPGFNLGSLVFIYANPMGNAFGSSFSLQNGATFTAGTNGTLRALVNDTNYSDNPSTGFTVTFAPTATGAVPEPATWAMMIGGFGAIGGAMRYRRRKVSVSFG